MAGVNGPVLSPGNVPVIRSQSWHSVPPFGGFSSSNVPDGRLFALPLWPGRRCLITGVAVNVTLALAGGNLRFGLYTQGNGLPLTRVADFGTVTSGVLGIRQITGLRTRLACSLHFICVARQGGVLNLGLTSRDTWDPLISETTPALAANLSAYYIDGVTGALPPSFGAPAGTVQGPSISVQLM